MRLEITLLGTGTSTGVPVIGCRCSVCTSGDPRNRRLRPGARIEVGGRVILLDAPVDLRQQALRYGLERVDAVLFTHAHADHVFGLDELRIFNFRQGQAIPCYGSRETLSTLRRIYAYAFEEGQEGGGKPRLELMEITGPFDLEGLRVVPVPVLHGQMPVYGFRFGPFAYVTDVSFIPQESFELLAGVEVLVLGALRYRPHSTHFNIPEAVAAAQRIGARRTILTHIAHEVDHGAQEVPLPRGVELGVDGLDLVVG
jgi:phosphoribosyl 1,2-cyclic phosphate phosphodiesterase